MSSTPKPLFFFLVFFYFLCNYTSLSSPLSLHLPLTSVPLSSTTFTTSLLSVKTPSSKFNIRSKFKYSMALIISLPIGTPPQTQQMVLDTGSQLSWIQCHRKKLPPKTSFDPSLSSSFSTLPCSHPLCKPPLILGCATDSSDDRGILGMNRGRLSFVSQAKVSKFSYCIPPKSNRPGFTPTGSFYLGDNPNSKGFKYVSLLNFPESQRMPNLDPLAYTVPMIGIKIGLRRLNISGSVFRPDAGGSGQTMVDSGSEFTHLVDAAYDKVREEIMRLVGPRLKKGYIYGGTADMCFGGNVATIQRLIGDLVFEFSRGVEILVPKERVLVDVGGGVHCIGIGRSSMLGAASNIIGNVHQQNIWVEFDVTNRRVGFAKADCTRLP